ncbi:hypothetical protein Tco_0909427 [Tanacetum coccineum]|uniref:Uncharacterized protein n=1 Tax=Tanacetum coccineum TaxID=301880 RepID=A0ABQ5CRX9_9ASTR
MQIMLLNSPFMFDDLMVSTVDFTKFAKHCLQKDKITKVDLKGAAFKLLKGNYKNYIELEYNMKQNPLPLQGPPDRTTIPVDFFFNKYPEYLKQGNTERKYTSSLTKLKAARARHELTSSHSVYSRMKILSIIRISIDKQFGYGYLKEIMVRRADQKEYVFKEADFPKLHLNDIEDIGVVYLNKNNGKYLMRADELYKFSDGTLKLVRDIPNSRLHNFELGYNASMPKRA